MWSDLLAFLFFIFFKLRTFSEESTFDEKLKTTTTTTNSDHRYVVLTGSDPKLYLASYPFGEVNGR